MLNKTKFGSNGMCVALLTNVLYDWFVYIGTLVGGGDRCLHIQLTHFNNILQI